MDKKTVLSEYEKKKLEILLPYVREVVRDTGELPTVEDVRRHLTCGSCCAQNTLRYIQENDLAPLPPPRVEGELNPHETELLDAAVQFMQGEINKGKLRPTQDDLRRALNCGTVAARQIHRHVVKNKLVDQPPETELKETNEMTDDTWTITLPKTRIHTLEELIAFFKIDLEVWEVEKFIANKWEMGYKDAQTQEPGHYELYQVKAYLIRKRFNNIVDYAKDNAKLRSQVEKLKLEVRTEREQARILGRNHAGYDDVLANIKELASVIGDLQLPYSRINVTSCRAMPAVSQHHTEDAVLLLSDTHFGARSRAEDTSGFPEYGLVISGNRMGYIVQKAKQILSIHRTAYPIKRLYVWIGGDVGNGILHDSPMSNELFPPAQVHFGYHMLKFAIEDLLTLTVPDENGIVVVEEIVLLFSVGNHMRMDEKMPHAYQAQRTLDWLIYQFIIERFSSNPKVLIHQTMSPFIFEAIRGHRHLFAHGMQVGYKNSPDAQNRSISRFLTLARALFDSPEWRKKNGLENETFSRAVVGDIHVPVRYPRFISNGSLPGQNDLGVNWTLEPIPAGQWLWGVSNEHQETWHYFLECSKVQREKKDMNVYGEFSIDYMQRIGRGGA